MLPTNRSAIALAPRCPRRVLMMRMSISVKTASKAAVNLASRSRIRNRNRRSARAQVHAEVAGKLGQPRPDCRSADVGIDYIRLIGIAW